MALKTDGSVVVWGGNAPAPAGLIGVTAIAAGRGHTVALKSDASVVAWGAGTHNTGVQPDFGQSLVPLAAQSGVAAIAAGDYHTVAILRAVTLQARRSGNDLVLSWPATATGFTLQSTLSLTPPVTWIDLTIPPAMLGGQFTVMNTNSGGPQFYQLRKP